MELSGASRMGGGDMASCRSIRVHSVPESCASAILRWQAERASLDGRGYVCPATDTLTVMLLT
jgi:hypothetical protein